MASRQFEAGDAPDIFWWSAAGTTDIARVFGSGNTVGDRFNLDHELPVAVEVIGVGQLCKTVIDSVPGRMVFAE